MNVEKQKDILLSVKPPYANLIVDGLKTVELRRKFPNDIEPGTRCLIYSTSPVQKVIGECKISEVVCLSLKKLWRETATTAMISWDDFSKYFSGTNEGYAVRLYGYIRYEEPKELVAAAGIATRPPQSYRYLPAQDSSVTM